MAINKMLHPRGRIIDRYLLREISFPFLASLFSVTFVLLLGRILQLMDLMVNKGVRVADVGKLILFLMPYFLLYTIPISLLIAILTGLGRMARDNEITVLKGAGISLYRISLPIAGASFLSFLTALSLSLFFVPHTNQATRNLLFTIVRHNASVGIKEKVFNDNFKGLLLYANTIPADGNYMEGVLISDNRLTGEPHTIVAEKAFLVSDPESLRVSLRLEKGSIHTLDFKKRYYRKMDFSSYDINLDMEASVLESDRNKTKESNEMTIGELLAGLRNTKLTAATKREFLIELNKKFTFPVTCLIFAILGLSLGVTGPKATRGKAVTMGMMIVICYYLLQLWAEGLIEMGKISPGIGAWFPNIIFMSGGISLLVMAAEEKQPDLGKIGFFLKNLLKGLKSKT